MGTEQCILQLPLLCLPETPPPLHLLSQEICRAGPWEGRITLVLVPASPAHLPEALLSTGLFHKSSL